MKAKFKVVFTDNDWIESSLDVSKSPNPIVDVQQHARYLLRKHTKATEVRYTDSYSSVKRIMSREDNIKEYMLAHYEACREKMTGEISATQLAEDTAEYFDAFDWLDDHTHIVWDVAVDVALEYE